MRNHNGKVIVSVARLVQYTSPIHAIEAQALILGFELASQIGTSGFVIESNNLEVVKMCHATNRNDRSPLEHFIQEIF